MSKNQWLALSGGLAALVLIVVGFVVWGNYHRQLDEDSKVATKEQKEVAETSSDKLSEELGEDIPTKEELEQYITNLEKREGSLTQEEKVEKIKGEYGDKAADLTLLGYLVSEDMSLKQADEMKLLIRGGLDDSIITGVPVEKLSNPLGESLKATPTDAGYNTSDFSSNTEGFSKEGSWYIGYPRVSPDGLIKTLDGDQGTYKEYGEVSFYAYTDKDVSVREASDQLSKIDVSVSGHKADPAGTLAEKKGTISEDVKGRGVFSLFSGIKKNLWSNGKIASGAIVKVSYEMPMNSLLPDGTDPKNVDLNTFEPVLKIGSLEYKIKAGRNNPGDVMLTK